MGTVAFFCFLEEQEDDGARYKSMIIFSSFGSTGTQGQPALKEQHEDIRVDRQQRKEASLGG